MREITSIEEIRNRELNILKYVHHLCEKYNLKYILAGGTLLGAIRHKGYIPWDDDIDILMPRDDYEKLIKIINNNSNKNFRFITCDTERDYYLPFGKIVDIRTYLEFNEELKCKNMGVFIDVFPMDGMDRDSKKWQEIMDKYATIRKEIDRIRCNNKSGLLEKMYSRWLCKYVNYLSKYLKYKNCDTVACKVAGFGIREIITKEFVEQRMGVQFENQILYAPVGYDTYLRNLYNEYMKLPPKHQQRRGHLFKAWYR